MEYTTYKVIHLIGVFMVLVSLGGLVAVTASGSERHPMRKLVLATNGIGLLVSLVAGFGLLARLEIGWPGWVFGKIVIWLILAAMSGLVRRRPESASLFWWGALLLAAAAANLAVYKPF